MKPIYILLACFLLPGVVKAQTSSANPDSSANDTNLATEVKALREALLQTQRQMAAQQREIEGLKAQSKDGATRTVTNEPAPSPSEIVAGDSATSSVEPLTEQGPGSPNTKNRAIQQATFDWLQTFWKHPRYGALQTYVQYSYLTRAPRSVAPGDPKNAHLSMVYAGFRYVLPSSAGTLLRLPYAN
jgi:hypothetical protein